EPFHAEPVAPKVIRGGVAEVNGMTYDQARDIRFRPDKALWRDEKLPFEVAFFHPGFFNTETVKIHEVEPDGQDRPVAFDTALFDYGHNAPPAPGQFKGFAGFRVHYAINRADHKDEVVVFLGASYFRAVGKDQRYGLSARGLAIDTVGGKSGEEFPRFTEFWLEKPAAGATALVIEALLDSASVTGAYRFVVTPGTDTLIDVQARLFARRGVGTLGLAPLTSMFFSGENQPRAGDFRPEVHDSDGLSIESGTGEWIWRPLTNPSSVFTTSFALASPKGFGLMQRDRSFADYQDTEARYELRPSAWIEPAGDWGQGRIELVELSTPDETNDNAVAYWVPQALPQPGKPYEFSYRMRWQGAQQQHPPGAWVTQTRVGRSYANLAKDERQLMVDFDGPALRVLAGDAPVKAVITPNGNAEVLQSTVYHNEGDGSWRLALRIRQRREDQPVELRGYLENGHDILSETWSYVIPPR
ncbi:MAG TPA: glucan biosynthesis protein G, partial [Burkholderiaceae bacterium]|nr:glucan biosynthesis protein G [Burkholderiaceae bacterium]